MYDADVRLCQQLHIAEPAWTFQSLSKQSPEDRLIPHQEAATPLRPRNQTLKTHRKAPRPVRRSADAAA